MGSLVQIPVAVVMERREVQHGRWRLPKWTAVSVLPAAHLATSDPGRTVIRGDDDVERYLYSGFRVELFRDGAESYWYNLTGENASLYVICHEDPDGGVNPFQVTADHDEATAGLEADNQVFAVPIHPEIYKEIEGFILEYYVPEPPRKRKRKNWSDNKR